MSKVQNNFDHLTLPYPIVHCTSVALDNCVWFDSKRLQLNIKLCSHITSWRDPLVVL